MLDSVLSLDVGSRFIKALVIKRGFKDFTVKSCKVYDRREDEDLHLVISHIINDLDGLNSKIILSIPQEDIILRNLQFPFSDTKKISQAVPFEAEEQLPFDIDSLQYDFTILTKVDSMSQVLFAGIEIEKLEEFLTSTGKGDLVDFIGIESISMFETYCNVTSVPDETVVQCEIGNSKTILNLIRDKDLIYTRAIPWGMENLYMDVSGVLNKSYEDVAHLMENLSLDLTSFDNNLVRSNYTDHGLTKPKLKKIYNCAQEFVEQLAEELSMSLKSSGKGNVLAEANRLLLSGGGSLVMGLSHILSAQMDMPVIPHPLPESITDIRSKALSVVNYGTTLSYLKHYSKSINLSQIKHSASPFSIDLKELSLPILFLTLGLILFIINITLSTLFSYSSTTQTQEILAKRYKQYFRKKPTSADIIGEAKKLLKEEQKKIKTMGVVLPKNISALEILRSMLQQFPKDSLFTLKNIVINKSIIRLDATAESSKVVDEFRNSLTGNNTFDSVTVSIKKSSQGSTNFSMTIKLKTDKKKDKKGR